MAKKKESQVKDTSSRTDFGHQPKSANSVSKAQEGFQPVMPEQSGEKGYQPTPQNQGPMNLNPPTGIIEVETPPASGTGSTANTSGDESASGSSSEVTGGESPAK